MRRESTKQRNDFYYRKRSRRSYRDRKKPPKPRCGDTARFHPIRCAMPPPLPRRLLARAHPQSPTLFLNLPHELSISCTSLTLSSVPPSSVPQSKHLFSGTSRGGDLASSAPIHAKSEKMNHLTRNQSSRFRRGTRASIALAVGPSIVSIPNPSMLMQQVRQCPMPQPLGGEAKGPNMARGGWIAYLKIYKLTRARG